MHPLSYSPYFTEVRPEPLHHILLNISNTTPFSNHPLRLLSITNSSFQNKLISAPQSPIIFQPTNHMSRILRNSICGYFTLPLLPRLCKDLPNHPHTFSKTPICANRCMASISSLMLRSPGNSYAVDGGKVDGWCRWVKDTHSLVNTCSGT